MKLLGNETTRPVRPENQRKSTQHRPTINSKLSKLTRARSARVNSEFAYWLRVDFRPISNQFELIVGSDGPAGFMSKPSHFKAYLPFEGGLLAATQTIDKLFGVRTGSSLRETHQLRCAASHPTSIHGFPRVKNHLDPQAGF